MYKITDKLISTILTRAFAKSGATAILIYEDSFSEGKWIVRSDGPHFVGILLDPKEHELVRGHYSFINDEWIKDD